MLVHHGVGRDLAGRQHRLQVLLLEQDHGLVLHVVVRLPALPGPAVDGDWNGMGKGGTGARRSTTGNSPKISPCSCCRHDGSGNALCVGREVGGEDGARGRVGWELVLVVDGHRGERGRWLRWGVEVVPVD